MVPCVSDDFLGSSNEATIGLGSDDCLVPGELQPRGKGKQGKGMFQRRFRAYNVGIAKSGTTSIAGIFSQYRAAHEFMFPETTKAISDYKTGLISKEEFIGFMRAGPKGKPGDGLFEFQFQLCGHTRR